MKPTLIDFQHTAWDQRCVLHYLFISMDSGRDFWIHSILQTPPNLIERAGVMETAYDLVMSIYAD
jgi:hypothetical protein